jgi:O-antigen/teichoic acid export membrane protein
MSLGRHTAYNLLGSIVPMGLAFLTVPIYLNLIGPERYGVLAICWLFLGYFGLFDLGLGRATAYRIAKLRDATRQERADTFCAAMMVNIAMGVVGGLVLYVSAQYFFEHVFKVDPKLRPEMVAAAPLLAFAVPVALLNGVAASAMGGRERFLELNLINIVTTAVFQIFPLIIALVFGPNLPWVLGAALVDRLLTVFLLTYRCHNHLVRGCKVRFVRVEIVELLKYGGWVNLSSLYSPILYMVDRFSIGAVLGAAAVTDYTVPLQLSNRMQMFPSALTTALFPKLSAAAPDEQDMMARQATRAMSSILTLPYLGAIFAISPFLHLWVGRHLAAQSDVVGRIALLSMWINGFALISYIRLQASRRPDLVAKVMMIEVIPYLLCLYFGMTYLGLMGAALALVVRQAGDLLLLTWAARRRFSDLPVLAVNFAVLVAGAWLAGLWPITDWRFWAVATLMGSFTLALGWLTLPRDIKALLVGRLQEVRSQGLAAFRFPRKIGSA